ncbi:MAG TPA: WYL domain-containing protein [Gammaproteobacteria bacterium]|nr:WYL domain-containing protein [Gammaproteobacteria bacterium]
MSDPLFRQWCMLRMIPRAPRRISVDDIRSRLSTDGYDVTTRTIQRDLINLSDHFPLACDDRGKPYGWYWAENAAVLDVPGMDPGTALTFKLAEMFLTPALPPEMRRQLDPHFKRAADILKPLPLRRWTERVRIVPRGQPMIAPPIRPAVIQAVYEALLHNRRLQIKYFSRQKEDQTPREAEVSPLGLVIRDSATYLVCGFWDYEDVRTLAVHRIQSAEVLETAARKPPEFDLDSYISAGGFDIPVGPPIRLVARFTVKAAYHLHEGGLSKDQQITPIDDKWTRVTAMVADTAQLRWWLLGFGEQVVVEKPVALRRQLAKTAVKMAGQYRQNAVAPDTSSA